MEAVPRSEEKGVVGGDICFFFFAADMFFIIICSNMYEDVEDEQTKIKDYSGMYRRLIVVGT